MFGMLSLAFRLRTVLITITPTQGDNISFSIRGIIRIFNVPIDGECTLTKIRKKKENQRGKREKGGFRISHEGAI